MELYICANGIRFQGHVISLSQQIRNFEKVTLPELEAQSGRRSRVVLPKYLFVVGTGGNDYSFNYFLRNPTSNVSDLEVFTANLTASLSQQLKVRLKKQDFLLQLCLRRREVVGKSNFFLLDNCKRSRK